MESYINKQLIIKTRSERVFSFPGLERYPQEVCIWSNGDFLVKRKRGELYFLLRANKVILGKQHCFCFMQRLVSTFILWEQIICIHIVCSFGYTYVGAKLFELWVCEPIAKIIFHYFLIIYVQFPRVMIIYSQIE